jgi:hypothetical protein
MACIGATGAGAFKRTFGSVHNRDQPSRS